MNAERIISILLEGDMSPEEFMSDLPKHVVNRFDFVKSSSQGLNVYVLGPGGRGFIGLIINMSPTGNMWYAARLDDGLMLKNAEYRRTKEEAAEDLYRAKKDSDRWNESMEDPAEFMNGMPEEFWANFHIIKSGENSVYADAPWRYSSWIVYVDKPGIKNSEGNQIRDFIGLITQGRHQLWEIVRVASPHLTRPGHSTHLRAPVTPAGDQGKFRSKEEAAKALLADYLTEK